MFQLHCCVAVWNSRKLVQWNVIVLYPFCARASKYVPAESLFFHHIIWDFIWFGKECVWFSDQIIQTTKQQTHLYLQMKPHDLFIFLINLFPQTYPHAQHPWQRARGDPLQRGRGQDRWGIILYPVPVIFLATSLLIFFVHRCLYCHRLHARANEAREDGKIIIMILLAPTWAPGSFCSI